MASPALPSGLLIYAAVAVLGVIVLIARFKIHPFVALTLGALFVGFASGMKLAKVTQAFQEGIGTMLGSIAAVVGLGMIIGKLLSESGGAQVIAQRLIRLLGEQRLDWTMLVIGFIVGIPVFFTVGVVLLVPILFPLLRQTRQPVLRLGVPMLAGLSVVHGLVPPHPGPMAAIGITHADPGKTIFYSLLLGLPAAVVAGPLFGRWLARRRTAVEPGIEPQIAGPVGAQTLPTFGTALFTILLPVLLMLLATIADILLPPDRPARSVIDLVGSPTVAMLITTLCAFYTFGTARGLTRERLLKSVEECLGPAGSILLVVGAGGGFNRVLVASGVGDELAGLAKSTSLSPLLLGWLIAALIRIATGSATVAITTAAGLAAPYAQSLPGTNVELFVVAMGAGSLILSHVNDGGFWFVKEYLGLTVAETLRSWTVMETILSIAVLILALLVDAGQ